MFNIMSNEMFKDSIIWVYVQIKQKHDEIFCVMLFLLLLSNVFHYHLYHFVYIVGAFSNKSPHIYDLRS